MAQSGFSSKFKGDVLGFLLWEQLLLDKGEKSGMLAAPLSLDTSYLSPSLKMVMLLLYLEVDRMFPLLRRNGDKICFLIASMC